MEQLCGMPVCFGTLVLLCRPRLKLTQLLTSQAFFVPLGHVCPLTEQPLDVPGHVHF